MPAPYDPRLTPGAILGGKYRLLRPLGQGGMGAVWAARNEATAREVAVKLLLQPDPEHRARLLQEAKACGRVRHRNVIGILDAEVTEGGEPFLVMELFQGEILTDVLKRKRRLAIPEAARIGRDIARGLAAAHALNVIHRDLKPGNVFLHQEEDEQDYTVKVLDFGISKLTADSEVHKTATGIVLGSPSYMSPEQIRGLADIDGRSDLWSLGVVLFEMLAGARPFQGNVEAILVKVLSGEPAPIGQLVRNLDPAFAALVHACLQRDRDRRPASAAELAARLEAFAAADGAAAPASVARPSPMEVPVYARPAPAVQPQAGAWAPEMHDHTTRPLQREGARPQASSSPDATLPLAQLRRTTPMGIAAVSPVASPIPAPSPGYAPAAGSGYAPAPVPASGYAPVPGSGYAPAPRYAPAPAPAPGYAPAPAPGSGYAPAPGPPYAPAPTAAPTSAPSPRSGPAPSSGASTTHGGALVVSGPATPASAKRRIGMIAVVAGIGVALVSATGVLIAGRGSGNPAASGSGESSPAAPTGQSAASPGGESIGAGQDSADKVEPASTAAAAAEPASTAAPADPEPAQGSPAEAASGKGKRPSGAAKRNAEEVYGGASASAEPPPPPPPAGPFNEAVARATLRVLAGQVGACKGSGAGTTGSGKALVSFMRDGSVLSVSLEGPLGGSPAASCIASTFRRAHVDPFTGPLPTVVQSFTIR